MDDVLRTEARIANLGNLTLAVTGLFIVIGVLAQCTTYLNHDVAWVLYSTSRMLDGAVYGRDIIEPNLPLAWFLTVPSAAAARVLGADPIAVFRIFVISIALVPLAHAGLTLRSAKSARMRADSAVLIIALSYALFVGCYRDFGQREHLSLALVLPYLLVTASRLNGARPSLAAALAFGAVAGVGCTLKPYFLTVPLFVELAAMAYSRRWRTMFRAETIALGFAVAACAAAVLILTPAYLRDVVPLVEEIYWAYNIEPSALLLRIRFELVGLAVALVLYWRGERTAFQTVLLAACFGYLVSYLLQMKGYTYHGLPLRALVPTTLALQLSSLRPGGSAVLWRRALSLGVAGAAVVLILGPNLNEAVNWYRSANLRTGPAAHRIGDVVRLVQQRAANGTFLALSTHPFPGFPVVLYTDAKWGGRTNSQFLLPAIAKLRAAGTPPSDPLLQNIENQARTMLRDDLERAAPALILVDARKERHALGPMPFDFVAFYLEDPELSRHWHDYTELAPIHGYRVFVREARSAIP